MITVSVLIVLGILTQVAVLTTTNNEQSKFNHKCTTCGYQVPPMERPPALYDCPNCQRLLGLGVDLSTPLPRL